MNENGTKRGKKKHYGQKFRSGTGTTIQKPIGTGTDASGTGTTIHNQSGTGTK